MAIRRSGVCQSDAARQVQRPPVDGYREVFELPIETELPAVFICLPKSVHQERCVRLETIDAGTILLDGVPLPQEGKELARLRADIGMVFQSFNLFAHKTILQNVTLGLFSNDQLDFWRASAGLTLRF